MAQIEFVLTEYSEELLIFLCGLIIVLLAVTLHRIGCLTKLIQENSVDTKGGQVFEKKSGSQSAMLTEAEMEALLGEEVQMGKGSGRISMQPEELLAEVLDEVFL